MSLLNNDNQLSTVDCRSRWVQVSLIWAKTEDHSLPSERNPNAVDIDRVLENFEVPATLMFLFSRIGGSRAYLENRDVNAILIR
jgi:hypothetical protein